MPIHIREFNSIPNQTQSAPTLASFKRLVENDLPRRSVLLILLIATYRFAHTTRFSLQLSIYFRRILSGSFLFLYCTLCECSARGNKITTIISRMPYIQQFSTWTLTYYYSLFLMLFIAETPIYLKILIYQSLMQFNNTSEKQNAFSAFISAISK